jgi:hypothetical protein
MIAWKASIALLLTLSKLGAVSSDACVNTVEPGGEEVCLSTSLPLGDFELIAGQNEEAGTISIDTNEIGDLIINFETNEDWCLLETHVHVFLCDVIEGEVSPNKLPKPFKNGNPAPGQFDYKHENLGCVYSDEYTIDNDVLPDVEDGGSICIATHAVVKATESGRTETAWGGETEFPGKNWATYIKPKEGPCIYPCEFKDKSGAALRYRDLFPTNAQKGRFMGQGDLGGSACRGVDADTAWACKQVYPIKFQYDPDASVNAHGTVFEYFNGASTPTSSWAINTAALSPCNIAPPEEWDALKIQLRNTASTVGNGLINFNNVYLDDNLFGDFCGSKTAGGFTTWTIYPVALGDGFVVEGEFEVTNTDGTSTCVFLNSAESQKFEIIAYKASVTPGCSSG